MFSNLVSAIEYFEILLPLAMILLLSKVLAILCRKIKIPQVVGMLIAGIIIGCIKYIPGQNILNSNSLEGLSFLAKIGVILIMFSAGIETDFHKFISTGVPSVVITVLGVLFPVSLGFIVATAFSCGFDSMTQADILTNLFYGTILAATSVSVTVACLKELGKLNSKAGTSIMAAAILDDIIGVILLSLIISIKKGEGSSDIGRIIGMMIAFFAAATALGLLLRWFLNRLSAKYPHRRRTPILAIALCFFFAYAAEKWFGVADITGAYVAGILLSSFKEANYVDSKVETSNYLIFAPVFFANIGITADFSTLNSVMVGFGFAFIAAGILGKVIGCGLGSLICGYSLKDSIRVGIGMMVRAEVVLVCTQKGIDSGLIDPNIMPFVLILILISTLVAPLIMKLTYKNEPAEPEYRYENNFLDNIQEN